MSTNTKPLWQSKTAWSSLLVAVASFYPPAQAFVTAYPEVTGIITGLLFGGLRATTNTGVKLTR